jgi:hypothetical protein
MRFAQYVLLSTLVVGPALPAVAAAHARRIPAKSAARRTVKTKMSTQKTIDDDRATQLQAALIKSGYLTGQPSGHWDAQSEAAMAKLQADNGWQTKLVPDSRAILKLGLGPTTASASSPDAQGGASGQPSALAPQ